MCSQICGVWPNADSTAILPPSLTNLDFRCPKSLPVLLVIVCLTLPGCSDLYGVSYDRSDDFVISGIHTFGWAPVPTGKKKQPQMDEISLNRVRNAIADDLRQKGLMGPTGDPDALIDVSFGAKNASRRSGRNSRYR